MIGQPMPPYSQNPWPKMLAELMSDISEEHWCAGWMMGNEFTLWHIVQNNGGQYGLRDVNPGHVTALRGLSQRAGGWIVWDDKEGERFMPMDEWLKYYEAHEEHRNA